MEIKITAKNISVPANFNEHAEKKLKKLNRFFGEGWDAKITLETVKGNKVILELTVLFNGLFFRAEEMTETDKNDALDKAVSKIIRQIRKNKTKVHKSLREGAFEVEAFDEEDVRDESDDYDRGAIRVKTFEFRTLDVSEAILQMNLLGHNFFVFTNAETGSAAVVYKRQNGGYALIQQEKN